METVWKPFVLLQLYYWIHGNSRPSNTLEECDVQSLRFRRILKGILIFAISTLKARFCIRGDVFEVRKAASSVGFGGERPDDGSADRRRGMGRSPANPTLLAAFLNSKASPSIQNRDFGVDIAKIRSLGLCYTKFQAPHQSAASTTF